MIFNFLLRCSVLADQRKVGLDFFFCIEDAALLFAEEPEAILKATDAKSLSTYFKDKSLTNFDDGHSTLEKRIAQILMCETNPFKEFAMHEMLQDDGWQILRKQNNPIYIPKEKAQLKIKTTNLSQFSEGEDYIIGDSALVDYVTEQANLAYFKKASGEVDSEDEDGADDAETETSSSEIEDEDVEIKAEPEVVEIESDIEEKKKGKKANAQQGKKASAKKQSSSSAKASKVPSHMAENYATWTAEYKVLDDLRNNKRYFGVIYSALQVLGWKTIYDKAANGYICASWCIEYGEKLGFISGKRAIDMSQFLQNIDYFAQDSEGKDALMNYLEAYGFVRSPSYPAEASSSKDEQYRLSSRSPTRALYKATEPSEHSDRLLSEVGTTPQRMEADYFAENSPVGLSQDIDLSLLHELEDHLSSAPTFILEEQTANSDEKIKKDKELLAMLKTEPVNAGRIVSRLFRLHDWHRIYKPTNKTTYPDLDLAGCQSDVFFKPGANPADKNLIKKQDYFVTQESVVAYLQVLFGLKDVSSLTISSAEKPRRTRSGREIVCEDTEDPNSEIEDDDVMDIDQSDDKIGIVEEGEISIVSNTIPIEKYNEFAKESILDGIVLHDLGITPKTAWSKAISILMSKGWYKLNMKGHVYYFKNKLDFEKSSAKESEWRKKESVIFFTSEEQVKEYIQVKFRHEESVFSNVREKSPTSNKRYIETDTHDSSPKRSKFTEESFKNTHDTLGGYLDKAKDLLQSSTGGIITTFPVYSREDESIDLLSHVAASLCEGRGSVVYVCGGTGTGKTLSVDAVLNYVTKCKLKSKGCSDFQIVRTNGARITNMDHLMELMCEQLGKDVKFKQELKASLAIPAAPIAFGRSAYLENADLSVSQLSYSSSSSSERKSSPKSHRKKLNNFLVLIVNELDMLAPAVLRELITMATSETSSLLLIGTGNRVNAINSFDHTNRVFQVVFSAYGEDKLNNILEERAGKVFKRVAKAFLVKKVMSAQFKGMKHEQSKNNYNTFSHIYFCITGDVRKLLEAASEAVNAAKGKLSMEGK